MTSREMSNAKLCLKIRDQDIVIEPPLVPTIDIICLEYQLPRNFV